MATLRKWTPAEYVDTGLGISDCILDLERRARGYAGPLRTVLCTSAQRLRDAQLEISNLHEEIGDLNAAIAEEFPTPAEAHARYSAHLKGEELPPILPAEREIEIMVNEGGPSNVDS